MSIREIGKGRDGNRASGEDLIHSVELKITLRRRIFRRKIQKLNKLF